MQKLESRSLLGFISSGSNRAVKFDLMNSEYDGRWDLMAPHLPVSPELSLKRLNWLYFLSNSNKAYSLSSVGHCWLRGQLALTQLDTTVNLKGMWEESPKS